MKEHTKVFPLHGCFSSDQQEQDTLPYLPNWSENINAEY
jgi:hypothetical protein